MRTEGIKEKQRTLLGKEKEEARRQLIREHLRNTRVHNVHNTHTVSLTHTHTHTLSLSLSIFLSVCLSLSLS